MSRNNRELDIDTRTPEGTCLYKAVKKADFNEVQRLLNQGADCNIAHLEQDSSRFYTPIAYAAENYKKEKMTDILRLLYERRDIPTSKYVSQRLAFYYSQYSSDERKNQNLLNYIVSDLVRCKFDRVYPGQDGPKHDVLIAALRSYDAYSYDKNLSVGAPHHLLLKLRIRTLLCWLVELKTNVTVVTNEDDFRFVQHELINTLEMYYLLLDIDQISIEISKKHNEMNFEEIGTSENPELIELYGYYTVIAKNIIRKIKQLAVDDEYTFPTGWDGHAVCVILRRISDENIIIRIDNLSPGEKEQHETQRCEEGLKIRPKIPGQLLLTDLRSNEWYIISLIDSIKRTLDRGDAINLLYGSGDRIQNLQANESESVPFFIQQALANCFVKCYEPGKTIRFGQEHRYLLNEMLEREEKMSIELAPRSRLPGNETDDLSDFYQYATIDYTISHQVDDLLGKLRTNYERLSLLPRVVNPEKKTKIQDTFINVQMTHKRNRNSPHSSKMEESNIPVQLKDIFDHGCRVLVVGSAGSGKTTICQYIAYQWSQRRLWHDKFAFVFRIHLRNLTTIRYTSRPEGYSLIDVVVKECFQEPSLFHLDSEKLKHQLNYCYGDILWILDGCDERNIPDHLKSIEEELFAKQNLLLTSRPYNTSDLTYDVALEIKEFTDDNIKKYVHQFFADEVTADACVCSLYGHLNEIAHIPIMLELICTLWEAGTQESDSEAKLYNSISIFLLRRYLAKFLKQDTLRIADHFIYEHDIHKTFEYLEQFAFEATRQNQSLLKGDEMGKIVNDSTGKTFEAILQVGLLKPLDDSGTGSEILTNHDYYFIHRRFQEYLCARYMIRGLTSADSTKQEKEIVKFITYQKYNRYVQDTFCLFFKLNRSSLCTDRFWSAVDSEPRDLVGLRHCSRIRQWFRDGTCVFNDEDLQNINKRTTNPILTWISNKDRLPHDYSNTYLFESLEGAIDDRDWLSAWQEDLLIEDSSKRRYFLLDLWSEDNIRVLKETYDKIENTTKNVYALFCLVKNGPNKVDLKCLHIDPDSFTLHTVNDLIETPEFSMTAYTAVQEKAKRRKTTTTLTEFQALLDNYLSYSKLNRLQTALGRETWRVNVDPSELTNINNETLELLLKLSQKNILFFRDFRLPVTSFLELYSKQENSNEDILCSLIVSITFSSTCLLTASPEQENSIRVHENETFADIPLDKRRWSTLIRAFDQARNTYGHSSFFCK